MYEHALARRRQGVRRQRRGDRAGRKRRCMSTSGSRVRLDVLLQERRRQPRHEGARRRTRASPLLPLRDIIVFPHMVVPLFVGREKSIKALEQAMAGGQELLLAAQRKAKTKDDPDEADIHRIGTLGPIIQLLRLPDGTVKVLVEGRARAQLRSFTRQEPLLRLRDRADRKRGGIPRDPRSRGRWCAASTPPSRTTSSWQQEGARRGARDGGPSCAPRPAWRTRWRRTFNLKLEDRQPPARARGPRQAARKRCSGCCRPRSRCSRSRSASAAASRSRWMRSQRRRTTCPSRCGRSRRSSGQRGEGENDDLTELQQAISSRQEDLPDRAREETVRKEI